jgi:hypothetical protein
MSTNTSHASRMTAPSYDDDVRRGRFCCTQECNECIAGDDLGTAANAAQFRNRIHLLVEDTVGSAPLDLDQARRLVIVHHMHEHELGVALSGQETGTPQSHPRSGSRKIRSCKNSLHVLDKSDARPPLLRCSHPGCCCLLLLVEPIEDAARLDHAGIGVDVRLRRIRKELEIALLCLEHCDILQERRTDLIGDHVGGPAPVDVEIVRLAPEVVAGRFRRCRKNCRP